MASERDPRVRAYRSRDPRFDGHFFLGVRTTGVYCRPVCPAPSPRPGNVEFYACAAAAEEAGFRPCRRCRPETSPGTPAWVGTSATVSRAIRLIGEGALEDGNVEKLASRMGMTSRHLRRLFLKHLGASPLAIARTAQVHFARTLLDDPAISVARAALYAGFRSERRFREAIRKTFGRSPRELRARTGEVDGNRNGGLEIRLPYRPPLEWSDFVRFFGPRVVPGVEEIRPEGYRRTITIDGVRGVIEVRPGRKHALSLRVALDDPRPLLQVVERVRRIFDLDADPLRIADALGRDPRLGPVVKRRPGLRVPGAWDGFEMAVRGILGQQVSVPAATTLAGRLAATFGEPADDEGGLTHFFPDPERLSRVDIASIGIPRTRAESIRHLARTVLLGEIALDGSRDLDETVRSLVGLPGIGEWTAHYIAMRALREPDAFPATDLGVRRALGNGRPLGRREIEAIAEAWRPWRAYATVALWMGAPIERRMGRAR